MKSDPVDVVLVCGNHTNAHTIVRSLDVIGFQGKVVLLRIECDPVLVADRLNPWIEQWVISEEEAGELPEIVSRRWAGIAGRVFVCFTNERFHQLFSRWVKDSVDDNIIVNFGNVETRQIMCPRVDVFALESDMKIIDIIEQLKAKGFSRVPVYEENLDKITGVLYVKDLLPHLEKEKFNWTSLLRKPLYIPENKKLDDLLTEFKTKKIHMAIVVDEYGGTSGIITLEDVIEEIFGEISGEFDDEDNLYSKLDDQTFIFDSKINLQDFYRAINLKDSSTFKEIALEIETLGGFLIEKIKKIPRVGQVITHDSYKFVIEIVDKKRIKQVKLILPKNK